MRSLTTSLFRSLTAGAGLAALCAIPASAQDAPAPTLSLTLNTAQDQAGSCTLTFVLRNGLATPVEALVYEVALFDTEGALDRLMLFDMGALPLDRPRVRRFTVPDRACAALGEVLINGAPTCTGVAPGACIDALRPGSDTAIEVTG
jgi:hypothetical protein